MQLTLANFKKTIPLSILERGREYFQTRRVTDLELDDSSVWSAQVRGTGTYQVRIEQAANGKLTCSCTCPYDADPYCKHIAAVLYAIEEGFPERAAGKTTRPRQTTEDKLREALSDVSREELLEVVLEAAGRDRQFGNQLLLRFVKTGQSKASYSKMVKDALRVGYAEHGFIDYRGSMEAATGVYSVLSHADAVLARGQVGEAVAIFQAVLENVVEAISHADDSSGSLGECISHAFQGLQKAAEVAAPPERQALFEYCLHEAHNPRYGGWDWHWDLLEIATTLADTPEAREQLFAALDDLVRAIPQSPTGMHDWFAEHTRERAALIKLAVIERDNSPDAVDAFIAAHIDLDRFRAKQIERHLERGELDAAKRLAAEGVELNTQKRLPGLVHQYNSLLLDMAQREHDTQAVIRLARRLLLDRGGYEYYDLLKETVAADEWPTFVEGLIRDAQNGRVYDLVAWIYAREEMWPRLLAMVRHGETHILEQYRAELEARFPDDIAAIYERMVYQMLERTSDRGVYQTACAYLQRMKALGKSERVAEVVQDLKGRYRNRRALQEELERV